MAGKHKSIVKKLIFVYNNTCIDNNNIYFMIIINIYCFP